MALIDVLTHPTSVTARFNHTIIAAKSATRRPCVARGPMNYRLRTTRRSAR
jgi:hypothetical protein